MKLLPTTPCPNTAEHEGRCCCNCAHRALDFDHCTTTKHDHAKDGCVCGRQRGYVCLAPEFAVDGVAHVNSGWCEHGLCEMHDFVKKVAPDGKGKA